jgi:HlyD family secretion protein
MELTKELAEPNHAAPLQVTKRGWLKRQRRSLLTLLGVSALLGAVAYLRWVAPISAYAHRVQAGQIVDEVFGRGTIESQREAQLGFDLVGRLSEVLVDEGARVSLGQALARLYPEQVRADLRAATSGVAAARSSLVRLAAEEQRAVAALQAATREQRRAMELSSRGASTAQQLDLAEDALRSARADLDRVLAQRVEATRSIDVAEGGAAQRGATMLRATLLAPFPGLITRRLREPGDTVAVGTTVLRLVDTEHVYVRAWIDETMLGHLHEGQSAQIVLPGRAEPTPATVERVGWESDRQSHELLVDVAPTKPLGRIAMGQRADVWIATRVKKDVVIIPTSYARRDAAGAYCYVDRAGRVEKARVRLGVHGRDTLEINEGVRVGDTALAPVTPGAELALSRRWVSP